MKKGEQILMNEIVKDRYDFFKRQTDNYAIKCIFSKKRLRYCSAYVVDYGEFTILISYDTIVAFINNATGEFVDVLRYVYGYTATSAQHIAKFRKDFAQNVHSFYTYKAV